MKERLIEIMDTTLRDGEQTSGVSFMPHEKLVIARALLQKLNVDRIEVASARVSDGEMEAVRRITRWASKAGCLDRVEVLGFVDGTASVDWILEAGCRHLNLLCKGSHLVNVLIVERYHSRPYNVSYIIDVRVFTTLALQLAYKACLRLDATLYGRDIQACVACQALQQLAQHLLQPNIHRLQLTVALK